MADETDKTGDIVAESPAAQSPEKKESDDASAPADEKTATASDPKKTESTVASTKSDPAAAAPAAAAESSPAKSAAKGQSPNRNLLSVFGETMEHIEKCEQDKSIIFRHNDRKSVVLMLSAFTVEIILMCMFAANSASRPIYIGLAILADMLFGLAILWYVMLRFGVLRSFEPRQTLLTWQLMIGAGAIFAFYTMNIAFAFFTYYNWLISQSSPL